MLRDTAANQLTARISARRKTVVPEFWRDPLTIASVQRRMDNLGGEERRRRAGGGFASHAAITHTAGGTTTTTTTVRESFKL